MSDVLPALGHNMRWEGTRLRRSRRIWLLLIPVIAGPVGSTVADLYLRVPSVATAQVLGLLIVAGLSSLVVLDLTALAVGEDLAWRAHLLTLVLPENRGASITGRLLVAVGGPLVGFAMGGLLSEWLAARLVTTSPGAPAAILSPPHLLWGLFGLLIALSGVTAAASLWTRSSAQGLVAGVLAGVTCAAVGAWLLLEGSLRFTFPAVLAVIGLLALAWTVAQYGSLES